MLFNCSCIVGGSRLLCGSCGCAARNDTGIVTCGNLPHHTRSVW